LDSLNPVAPVALLNLVEPGAKESKALRWLVAELKFLLNNY
jgi:hypothetical protein